MSAIRRTARAAAIGAATMALAGTMVAPTALAAPPDNVSITVVNGRAPTAGELTSLVVVYPDGYLCGGTVVAPTKVVTAAHCVVNDNGSTMRPADIEVGVPVGRREPSNGLYRVSSVVVHPQYGSADIDIAVLTLTSAISGRTAVPAASASEANTLTAAGAALISGGWGTTSSGGNSPSDFLVADLKAFPRNACAGTGTYQLGGVTFNGLGSDVDWATALCAGGVVPGTTKVIDTCQGDSGGPLLAGTGSGTRLVGVVSWGIGCAGFEDGQRLPEITPGVYTRVSALSSWLAQQGVPVGGSSDPVDPVDPVDPDPTVPTPSIVSTTPSSGRIALTASISTAAQGSVRFAAGSAGTCTAVVSNRQAACTITGLTNGTTYPVTATFVHVDGRVSSASTVVEVLVAGKPGKPRVGGYFTLDYYGRVVIRIVPGVANGASTSTKVRCTASGQREVTRTVTAAKTRLNLTRRVLWTCRVTSTNAIGSASTVFTLKP